MQFISDDEVRELVEKLARSEFPNHSFAEGWQEAAFQAGASAVSAEQRKAMIILAVARFATPNPEPAPAPEPTIAAGEPGSPENPLPPEALVPPEPVAETAPAEPPKKRSLFGGPR